MSGKDIMIRAENLHLAMNGRDIFHIADVTLYKGEVLALVGPNGAGKSSLLLTLALLKAPTGGAIRIDGEIANNGNTLRLRRRMAVVFQEPLLLDLSVQQNIMAPLRIRGVPRREAAERTTRWLEQFGIDRLARRPARCLSGGEAQRASLARAFALEPEILFLDEPFAALDYPTRKALLNELGGLLEDMNITTLFVTHDYGEIPYLAKRVAVLHEGRIFKEGDILEVFGEEILKCSMWVPWET
jgi:tungstate transport system ATP-binding protein